ncbi:MAG: hypothetical protein C4527_29345 [Candidatus Omnitrophota bacterium]|jgi:hypothetical protein|nr:MAG: hypothetical protein C4527_29345 [Candidatus Omnitrophota bacterium]
MRIARHHAFVFTTVLSLLAISLIQSPSQTAAAEKPDRKIIDGVILTPHSTVRGAEGELNVHIGDPPRTIRPLVWENPEAGIIQFATTENNCSFQFRVSQVEIRDLSATSKAGILSVTAMNTGNAEAAAVIWTAWTNTADGMESPKAFHGVRLETPVNSALRMIPYQSQWNVANALYFKNRAFFRDRSMLYFSSAPSDWDTETWARRVSIPYHEFTPSESIGFQRNSITLARGKTAWLRVYVPFDPVPASSFESFETIVLNL